MDKSYVAEYYYEPHQKCWCAEIKDEDGNTDRFIYANSELSIREEIKIANQYDYNNSILRITKSQFYK